MAKMTLLGICDMCIGLFNVLDAILTRFLFKMGGARAEKHPVLNCTRELPVQTLGSPPHAFGGGFGAWGLGFRVRT